MSTTPTPVRNADLAEIVERLKTDHARKMDQVVPASLLRAENGRLVVQNGWTTMDEEGVSQLDLEMDVSQTMLSHVAGRLDIPVRYLRKLHAGAQEDEMGHLADASLAFLFDRNVNEWITRTGGTHMVRAFEPDENGVGFGRALLSDRYQIIDDLDVLTAALDGLRVSDPSAEVVGCDLTENRMRVRVKSGAVKALAPALLKGYRSPFGGAVGDENPTVFAGFEISNSETGGGSFTIVPRLVVEICSNGMRMTKDASKKIHLGGKLEEGMVKWSTETQKRSMDLVRSQTTDAVKTFMDVEYITRKLAELEEVAGTEVTAPQDTIQVIQKDLRWSDQETEGVLSHFIRGGQVTAGGILHAATAYAQEIPDADRAAEMEEEAITAMHTAARVAV